MPKRVWLSLTASLSYHILARGTPLAAGLQTVSHDVTGCVVACCILERECHDQGLTVYQIKRQASCHGRTLALPALELPRQAA
jgi:hypothetical protein